MWLAGCKVLKVIVLNLVTLETFVQVALRPLSGACVQAPLKGLRAT